MMPVISSWTQGAWVALDILLVALIIYQVLVMIRGTRAAPMLVGLVVVSVIFYLARIGELTTLNWVVGHVLPYLVFALIVVFQSEIRHVLADLGRRLTFLGGSSSESDSYDDIVLAANLFSQHQTGASMNPLLSTQLGTRHRAGIGITEETDAIAVICSEETGAISLAIGGQIERDLTVEQLRERLGSELRRFMAPVTLPTTIAQADDESDALLESPLREPAPQRKSESGVESEPQS